MQLEAKDILEIVAMLMGFSGTIAVLKSEVKTLKGDLKGISSKIGKVDEKVAANTTDIEVLKVRIIK